MKGTHAFFSLFVSTIPPLLFGHAGIFLKSPSIPHENLELNFFQRIQHLNLNLEDILGSYKNVSAEVQTQMCKTKCKTTMALWVLQNLKPCHVIEKADCPKGLVCCSALPDQVKAEEEQIKASPLQQRYDDYITDNDQVTSSFIPVVEEFDKEVFYSEPILDPIPDDESSEILKV